MAAMPEPITTPKPAKRFPRLTLTFTSSPARCRGSLTEAFLSSAPWYSWLRCSRSARERKTKSKELHVPSEASTAIPLPVKKSKSHRENVMATDHS